MIWFRVQSCDAGTQTEPPLELQEPSEPLDPQRVLLGGLALVLSVAIVSFFP